MRAEEIIKALEVGSKWTRQIKGEEKRPSARRYRDTMYTRSRVSLKEICSEHMQEAWNKASGGGRLPTHWRQLFYVMRPICDEHPDSDRPLRDATFKNILEAYLEEHGPGWDVLKGARGVFKEPHTETVLAMSTMNVRNYLRQTPPYGQIRPIPIGFPTNGATNRIAAVLICEKEGFDELLEAERIPDKYDLALMSTKGISAEAARDLARGLGVPCLVLHDMDKNGFVMRAGFPFATDIGIRMADVERWGLAAEDQPHPNPHKAYGNLIRNGATPEEAAFIAAGLRVELNMLTSEQFIRFVEDKLADQRIDKVMPDTETLRAAWERAHAVQGLNEQIRRTWLNDDERARDPKPLNTSVPPMPDDIADRIRREQSDTPTLPWDEALWRIATAAPFTEEA